MMDGLASPARLRPQVFTTSRRVSIRREPAGLVSCRIRSWGCTLQSFSPTAWPYVVSDADPLLVLVPARHHLYVPLPLAPAKAEASSRPGSRCLSVGAEAPPGRNRRCPTRRNRGPAEPNGRPTLGAPKRPSSRTVAPLSETEVSSSRMVARPAGAEAPSGMPKHPRGNPKHPRAEPRPPSESPKAPFGSSGRAAFRSRSPFVRSARRNSPVRDPEGSRPVRAERPLDPPEPKLRRMRRAALPARIRRSAWLGHRPALRGSEDPLRPDRSPDCPRPEGLTQTERSRSLPVEAEAPPEIRRSQPSATGAEAPLAPDERPAPPRPEGPSGSVRPASHAAVRRPRRSRRAPHPAPPSTEATVARDDPSSAAAIRRPRRLRSGCPSIGRPKTASGPSRIRRSARASAPSEDAVEVGQGVLPLRHPKTPSVRDPAGPLPRPEGRFGDPTGALLSAAETALIRAPPFALRETVISVSPRFPFQSRSLFRSGAALPKP
jgi:hypothetical protein